MAISTAPYLLFKKRTLNGGAVDLDSDTLKLTLHTTAYTPDLDADEFYDDLAGELASSGGYTAGGKTLASKVVAIDTGGDFAYLDAADVVWTALTPSAPFRYGVLRKDTGTPSTSPLIGVIDFGSNQDPAGNNFTVEWPAPASGGVLQLTS